MNAIREIKEVENNQIIIELPRGFKSKKVEIIILPFDHDLGREPIQKERVEQKAIENFLDKWTGFLKGANPDELKFQYLREKYE